MRKKPNVKVQVDQDAEVPIACQPLFGMLLNSASDRPSELLSTAADMVQADIATATLLRDFFVETTGRPVKTWRGSYGLTSDNPRLLKALIQMIARAEGNRLLKEMEM